MDRKRTGANETGNLPPSPSFEDFLLPSRAEALEDLRAALAACDGPLLLTGEPGVGKTWLWQRLRKESGSPWRWVHVDLTPSTDPSDFFRLIGQALGLAGRPEQGASRRELADFLQDRAAEGERWALVVDEAQNLSFAVAEEVRVLANRLGHPDGFSAQILVGQTELGRRLISRALAGLSSRLAIQIHLRPLDVDEARDWLGRLRPEGLWVADRLDRHHRDTGGNPRRLLVASPARRRAIPAKTDLVEVRRLTTSQPPTLPGPEPGPSWNRQPPVVESKPPLRLEEGMIEVGWEPSSLPEPDAGSVAPVASEDGPTRVEPVTGDAEEAIEDHYAALQAWNEWAQSQGRNAATGPAESEAGRSQTDVELDSRRAETEPATLRAEGQHEYAPYSQLFSRLKPVREVP